MVNLYYFYLFPVCLSIIASISVISVIKYFHLYEADIHGINYVTTLHVFSILTSVNTLLPASQYHNLCTVQGALEQTFSTEEIIWSGLISILLYLECCKKIRINIKHTIIYTVVFSTTLGITLAFFDLYHDCGGWCWISNKENKPDAKIISLRLILGYTYVIIYIFIAPILNYKVIKWIQRNNNSSRYCEDTIRKLRYYPYIIVVCYFPLMITRITYNPGEFYKIYSIVAGTLSRLVGFFNSFIFWMTYEVRDAISSGKNKKSIKTKKKSKILLL